jgi:hypothetical protein
MDVLRKLAALYLTRIDISRLLLIAPPAGQDRRMVSNESLTKPFSYDKRDLYVSELNRFHSQSAVNRDEDRARFRSCTLLFQAS